MGCVQSQPEGKSHKSSQQASKMNAAMGYQAEETAAARLLSNPLSPMDRPRAAQRLRPVTEVLKRASVFEDMHEAAHRPPELQDVHVSIGENSQRLLSGFEEKEAAARAKPQLLNVENRDLRQSKLFDKLKEYERKDELARLQPKLEKTFSQRQKENAIHLGLQTPATRA